MKVKIPMELTQAQIIIIASINGCYDLCISFVGLTETILSGTSIPIEIVLEQSLKKWWYVCQKSKIYDNEEWLRREADNHETADKNNRKLFLP